MTAAHGMAGEAAAPDWPPLTEAELAPVAEAWGLGRVRRVVWRSPRPFAASGIVEVSAGPVFVKRHDARVRSRADLAEEHAYIAHLRRGGAAVATVLEAGGATALQFGDGVYEVHAPAAGEDVYRDVPSWTPARNVEDAFALGAALGDVHRRSEGFEAPERRTRLIVAGDWLTRQGSGALDRLRRWAAEDQRLAAALRAWDWEADFARDVQPFCDLLDAMRIPALWGHGDFHASNLLWRNGAVASVLDFGLCNRLSAAHDLATAIERNCIAWLQLREGGIARCDLARALVRGYDHARPRDDAERAALPLILPVVHVELALSELAYFHGITGSSENARLAYREFLLGHACWFQSRESERLLEAVAG